MTVNFPGGGATPTIPGPRRVELPVIKTTSNDNPQPPQELEIKSELPDLNQTEQKRADAVQRASQSIQRDYFAVNDTTFSIFKDASGQYVTRFTSLRDGRVTYIPEPKIFEYLEKTQSQREAIVEISV